MRLVAMVKLVQKEQYKAEMEASTHLDAFSDCLELC